MTTVEVFTTESCTRCPEAIDRVEALADELGFEVEVVDAEADRGRALEYGVFSVPTVVIDGEELITGVPPVDRLRELVRAAEA